MIRFSAYCLLKPREILLLISAGLEKEEIESALYGQYLVENKRYDKDIRSMIRMFTKVAKKIVTKVNDGC